MATLMASYAANKSIGATWSLTVGTADSAFPLANLNNPYPDVVSKTTGTTATYRGTISAAAIQGIAIINCNLAGLTLTITNNNSMASQSLVVPAAAADGLALNAFIDLRLVTTSATQWNVAISSAAANIAIGKILLLSTLSAVEILSNLKIKEAKPFIVKRTSIGVARGYPIGTRYRAGTISLIKESERAAYTAIRRGSAGPTQPVVLVPESSVNDVLYGWYPDPEWEHTRETPLTTSWSDTIEELNPGAAL